MTERTYKKDLDVLNSVILLINLRMQEIVENQNESIFSGSKMN